MFPICSSVFDIEEMTARHTAALARVAEMAERMAAKHAQRMLEVDDSLPPPLRQQWREGDHSP